MSKGGNCEGKGQYLPQSQSQSQSSLSLSQSTDSLWDSLFGEPTPLPRYPHVAPDGPSDIHRLASGGDIT